jgi:hypothetical protein
MPQEHLVRMSWSWINYYGRFFALEFVDGADGFRHGWIAAQVLSR